MAAARYEVNLEGVIELSELLLVCASVQLTVELLNRHDVRKSIARVLTVQNAKTRQQLRIMFDKPLNLILHADHSLTWLVGMQKRNMCRSISVPKRPAPFVDG